MDINMYVDVEVWCDGEHWPQQSVSLCSTHSAVKWFPMLPVSCLRPAAASGAHLSFSDNSLAWTLDWDWQVRSPPGCPSRIFSEKFSFLLFGNYAVYLNGRLHEEDSVGNVSLSGNPRLSNYNLRVWHSDKKTHVAVKKLPEISHTSYP